MKNKVISIIVGSVIISVGSFYVGTKYGQGNTQLSRNAAAVSRFGQMGGAPNTTGGAKGGRIASGGFVTGQVISKDSTGITVKLTDGGSKIVFLSTSTPVTKTAEGTLGDISVGTSVSVIGTTNSDGSVTAQSIQIRPEMPRGN